MEIQDERTGIWPRACAARSGRRAPRCPRPSGTCRKWPARPAHRAGQVAERLPGAFGRVRSGAENTVTSLQTMPDSGAAPAGGRLDRLGCRAPSRGRAAPGHAGRLRSRVDPRLRDRVPPAPGSPVAPNAPEVPHDRRAALRPVDRFSPVPFGRLTPMGFSSSRGRAGQAPLSGLRPRIEGSTG